MSFQEIEGGVTAAVGFRAAGVAAGIKPAGRLDVAVLASDPAAHVAGVFTRNRIPAACVVLGRDRLRGGRAAAIVVNAGNANACTGSRGMVDAEAMCVRTAERLGVPVEQVFCSSTGVIGVPLPMDCLCDGIDRACAALSEDGGADACRAIMTSDQGPKARAVQLEVDGRTVTVGAMAKGAGMIEPNMATMLCYVTTDAAVQPGALQGCLEAAAADSFNRISVDGCQSTNDTLLLLANGRAGNDPLGPGHAAWPTFCAAVRDVCLGLALMIVTDGEGATKVAKVEVTGARDDADARRACRAVANSLLVKTAWYGCDPNWGRVIDAVGYSGAWVDGARVDILYDDVPALQAGTPVADALPKLEKVLAQDRFSVKINLHAGPGSDHVYASDCTEAYVRFNSAYTT